jgi:alpha-beta hydrolase superfamily lysophospholipase
MSINLKQTYQRIRVGSGDLVAGVKEIEEYFKMTDSFDIFCRRWRAVGEMKKSVICIHGIGGHSEDFRVMGQDLAEDGIEVYALDLRGFANSKEEALPRGDTSDFNRHLQDVDEVVDFVRKRHPKNKVYMLGYSLGVLYTLWYSANHPDSLDGIILAAPYWVGFMPRRFRIKIPFMLFFAPKTFYDSYKNWSKGFKESEEGKIILQDLLYTTKRSWRWLGGVKRILSDKALQNASQTEKPTLIILGEKDDISIRNGTKQLFERLATKDKSIQTFTDADHLFYDAFLLGKTTAKHDKAKRKQVTSVVENWLNTH